MYSVVGSDGQVYGPVDMATIGQWIQEGRIVATTSLIDPLDGHVIQAHQAPALYGMFPSAAPPTSGGPLQSAYPRPDLTTYAGPPKSKLAALLLAFFLGLFGIHRFYLGHVASGTALLLLTGMGFFLCGTTWIITGIWALVDLILIATDSLREANGRTLV